MQKPGCLVAEVLLSSTKISTRASYISCLVFEILQPHLLPRGYCRTAPTAIAKAASGALGLAGASAEYAGLAIAQNGYRLMDGQEVIYLVSEPKVAFEFSRAVKYEGQWWKIVVKSSVPQALCKYMYIIVSWYVYRGQFIYVYIYIEIYGPGAIYIGTIAI